MVGNRVACRDSFDCVSIRGQMLCIGIVSLVVSRGFLVVVGTVGVRVCRGASSRGAVGG